MSGNMHRAVRSAACRTVRMLIAPAAVIQPLEPRRLLATGPIPWPVGTEERVNTWTTGDQASPSCAMDANGNYVVAWTSYGQDGGEHGVYAQRFNAAGVPLGSEFRVNSYTPDTQAGPSVAMDPAGDFVIVWHGYSPSGKEDVYAQRYSATGAAQGGEFRVNTYTTSRQGEATVAMDATGNFVVAWMSYEQAAPYSWDVYAQRYSAAGVPQGSEFRVNTYTTSDQQGPSVAMAINGDFVVAWESYGQDGSSTGIYAQRYNAAGIEQGSEFRVNAWTASSQRSPGIAMDSAGDFVVAWGSLYQDGSGQGVYARRYNAAGVAQGSEFHVNTYTTLTQGYVSAAMDDAGSFIISWSSALQDADNWGIYARRYNGSGMPQGGEFRVNTWTRGLQGDSAVAMDADGDFVITWESQSVDGSGYGVCAQRYTGFRAASGASVGDRVWADGNGNGIQDSGESGAAHARVEAFTVDGVMANSAVTAADGLYQLVVPEGQYIRLHFIAPTDWILTKTDQGADDTADSDANFASGFTSLFTAGPGGATDNGIDAGVVTPASISGVVFYDRNGDGVRNGSEEALAGFEVFVDVDHDGVRDDDEPATASDTAGSYTINGVLSGACWVTLSDQDAWTEPDARVLYVPVGADLSAIDLPVRTTAPDSASTPSGSEFRINSYTTNDQSQLVTAMDSNGNFVVAWSSWGEDGSDQGIYARRYNSAGVAQGTAFRVNTYTTGYQGYPSVAMDADGDFVIAWQSADQDGSGSGVYAQRYNAAGVAQGAEFRINTNTINEQRVPSVAMDANGNFIVAWSDGVPNAWDTWARRYSAAGAPLGSEFRVNSYTPGVQSVPRVAMSASGSFVICWYGNAPDDDNGVHAQRYDAAGTPLGGEFRVNSYTAGTQGSWGRSIAMDAAGNFIIAWHSSDYGAHDGVYAQRFNHSGAPQGTEFRVNTAADSQHSPVVAMSPNGEYIIAWESNTRDGSGYGVYAQRYNAAGVPQGSDFRVNTYTSGNQGTPVIAAGGDSGFVVAWRSEGQDGSSGGIYAQRYTLATRPAVTSSEFAWNDASQRIKFTFDQDISASLSAADLVLENLTTGATIPAASITLNWNPATKTASFSFPSLPNGGSLPDGNYRATLLANGVFNTSGTSLAADWGVNFFTLGGDVNRDRIVDITDLGVLATNWQQSPRSFAQGDFNYDTLVDITDLGILATNWQKNLPLPASLSAAVSARRAKLGRLIVQIDEL